MMLNNVLNVQITPPHKAMAYKPAFALFRMLNKATTDEVSDTTKA